MAESPADGKLPPLHHLNVIDLTTELGVLSVRVLAGLGANVIRIEQPSGDPLRRKPPFTESAHGEAVSLYWLHMMANRQVLPLDLESDAGRDAFLTLLANADIVVESQPRDRLAAAGLDYDDLAARFPHLIWTTISPFGRTGPRADWAATDLIGMAAGGLMSLCGDPDMPPLRVSVEQGYAQAGVQAVTGTLAALHARNATGQGQLVDVSMQEAIAICLGNARLFYEFDGTISRRAGGGRAYGATGARLVYPCLDGHISMSRTPDAMAPLHEWITESGQVPHFDSVEWATLPQSGPGTPGPEKNREFEESLIAFFATKPKMELYEEGQRRGILICPVSSPADLLVNQQLIARGFFQEHQSGALGRQVLVQGPPMRFSATPWARQQDPIDVEVSSLLDLPSRPVPVVPANPSATSRDILKGLRVADFSWVGVGPLSTQVLAWLGADVIRVESHARLDVFRNSGPKRGGGGIDASAYFGNCNRDKRAITLNLKHPEARELALKLAAESDVLVESFRPDFMTSVGLSYDDIRAVNPGIIMMSASMEGATGPHTRFRGFGLTLQSTVGFTHFTSWPGRGPVGTGVAYTDWFATGLAASSVLAALEHRRRTGEGQYIDLSQLEACTWALDAEVFAYTAGGLLRPPLGNRHPEMAPHGAFPCAGDEEWIAIACRDDTEWATLAEFAGLPGLQGPALRTFADRKAGEDAIEAELAAWSSSFATDDLVEQLQGRGIPAYAVNDMARVHHDPQLRARGHFWRVEHPVIGEVDWDAPPYRLSRTPMFSERAAPLLGQDNEAVYTGVIGLSSDDLADLVAAGALD